MKINLDFILDEQHKGSRFDKAVSAELKDYSRVQVQAWIKAGQVTLNGKVVPGKVKVAGGEAVKVDAEYTEEAVSDKPEAMALSIVFEDDDVLVIDKPAGLVVHPGAGAPSGTLLNALLYHAPGLAQLPRAGIVHRLDKETSGVMVVAKSTRAYQSLVEQFSSRQVEKTYEAVVKGHLIAGKSIVTEMGRHPVHRTKMAVVPEGLGKEAITHYRVLQRFGHYTHLQVKIETGRTHQIRVHMAHVKHPIVGDALYGGRLVFSKGVSETQKEVIRKLPRQALHAKELSFHHPVSGEQVCFSALLPEDMVQLVEVLSAE